MLEHVLGQAADRAGETLDADKHGQGRGHPRDILVTSHRHPRGHPSDNWDKLPETSSRMQRGLRRSSTDKPGHFLFFSSGPVSSSRTRMARFSQAGGRSVRARLCVCTGGHVPKWCDGHIAGEATRCASIIHNNQHADSAGQWPEAIVCHMGSMWRVHCRCVMQRIGVVFSLACGVSPHISALVDTEGASLHSVHRVCSVLGDRG